MGSQKHAARFVISLLVLAAMPVLAHAQQIGCPDCPLLPPGPTLTTVTADAVTTSTTANHAVSIQLAGSTSNTGNTLLFALATGPSDGSVGTIQSDGTVTYTPNTDFIGNDVFTYTAADGSTVSSAATVNILVNAPTVTASDASISTTENTATTSAFSAVSSDSGALTYATSSDPSHGTLALSGSSFTYTPDADYTGSDSFGYTASEGTLASSTATVSITVSAPVETASIAVRDGSTLIGPVSVTLPDASAAAVPIAPSGSTTSYTVPARSVLALLSSLDAATSTFDITDLEYSNDFASFLLNCISVSGGAAGGDCYSWTYAVNGAFPAVGMDHTTLANGDTAYIFFGDSIKVATDKSSVATGESFTVTVTKYDPATGTYIADPNEVVGAVQFDANFNRTEFATTTTDASGQATLSIPTAGDYLVGTQTTGYFPNASITVTAAATGSGGGGGGGAGITHTTFNIPAALAYLSGKQNADGSLASASISDWVALAFAAENPGAALTKLTQYETSTAPSLASATDYERHAMALEALGINPYSGTGVDYITPIVNSFDGTQFGSTGLDNDDIFALFPLLHAGYSSSDSMIQKDVAFILSRQEADGSWDESTDMTAAAIDALGPLFDITGVNDALVKAVIYLKTTQQSDGGWSAIDSTSWAQTAINGSIAAQTPGLSTESAWAASSGFYPSDALASGQQIDGAVQSTATDAATRVWSTAYAVLAASGQDWSSVLHTFAKPVTAVGGSSTTSTTSTASTTQSTATTTAATSTAATTTPAQIASTTAATTTPIIAVPLSFNVPAAAPVAPTRTVSAPIGRTAQPAEAVSTTTNTPAPQAQTAAAASAVSHINYGSWWFLLFLILLVIFLGIVGWSITGAYFNRR